MALLVAVSCGLIGGMICAVLPSLIPATSVERIELYRHLRIVLAFATAMFSAIMVSTTLGLSLPFLFRKVGIDPVISSGPLVTTVNDAISVAIYLTLTLVLIR